MYPNPHPVKPALRPHEEAEVRARMREDSLYRLHRIPRDQLPEGQARALLRRMIEHERWTDHVDLYEAMYGGCMIDIYLGPPTGWQRHTPEEWAANYRQIIERLGATL